MRHVLLVLLALALPLAAQETKPVQQPDSPLVAAAKRMNRKGKKPANVITNDMVRQSGTSSATHVTTTTTQGTLNLPPRLPPTPATPEMNAIALRDAEKKKATDAAAAQKASAQQASQKRARAAEAAENGYEDPPPGAAGVDDAEELVGAAPPPPF
jgi:hypothetical protein